MKTDNTTLPLVSIIIPTHNRKTMVIRLLKSIMKSTYKHIEVIVVDDASTDNTYQAIKKTFASYRRLRVVRNKRNLFAAGARNVGTRVARGAYLFYVDDDNVLDAHAIAHLVRIFESDDGIGELGLVNKSFRDRKTVFWIQTIRNMWTTKTYLPNNLQMYANDEYWETPDVPNAFMVRASVIKTHGISFCEKFGIMYEESDLAYRIRKAGYTVKVVRDAIIYHDTGDYMDHFMNDARLPYVFARNRIIFHSLYSTKIQLLGIVLIWIWVFMLFYWYKAIWYRGNVSILQKAHWMLAYLKGNFAGISFIIRNEKLVYPKVT